MKLGGKLCSWLWKGSEGGHWEGPLANGTDVTLGETLFCAAPALCGEGRCKVHSGSPVAQCLK